MRHEQKIHHHSTARPRRNGGTGTRNQNERADNAGGAMYLIDRDGTILSTSTDAEELEPLIKAAIERE